METEEVYACANGVHAQAEEIYQRAMSLVVSAHSMAWNGPSRDSFQYEMERLTRQMTQLAEEGRILSSRIQRNADQWQELDASFARQFSQISIADKRQ